MNENIVFSDELTPKEVTQIIVSDEKDSKRVQKMRTADKYFAIENSVILKKRRTYYDKDRKEYDNPSASNVKIPSTFLRTLVEEKRDYALGKAFVFSVKKDDKEVKVGDAYYDAWFDFLEKTLYEFVSILAIQSINHGIGWAYLWIDDNGNFRIDDMPGDSVYPIWKDRNHTKIDRLVYDYIKREYKSTNPNDIEYAEYWTEEERHLFNVSDGYAEEEIDENNPNSAHMIKVGEDDVVEGISWDRVPFIAFKATDDEKPQLDFIKEAVDSYDMVFSNSVDGVEDALEPLLIFKGISPGIEDLIQAREIAKMTKTISVDPDGDASFIQPNLDVNSDMTVKEQLRKSIIYSGYGVDFDDVRFGNPNEMTIKCLFQRIDTYTDGLERHFQDFINDLKYFFDRWYGWQNGIAPETLEEYSVFVKFDRSMMMNESSKIDSVVKMADKGVVSKRTLLEYNPVVVDADMELERIEAERKEAMKLAEEQAKREQDSMFNFNQPDKEDGETEE